MRRRLSIFLALALAGFGIATSTMAQADGQHDGQTSQAQSTQASNEYSQYLRDTAGNGSLNGESVQNPRGGMLGWIPAGREFRDAHSAKGATAAASSNNLIYHNGPIMATNNVVPIFWNPSNYATKIDTPTQTAITTYFGDLAADNGKTTNVYNTDTQYYQASTATITKATYLSGTITFNAANSFAVGNTVTISGVLKAKGMTSTTFNGTFTVTGATATSFTVAKTVIGTADAYYSGGSAVGPQTKIAYNVSNAGAIVAIDPLPANSCSSGVIAGITTTCITDVQIQAEVNKVVGTISTKPSISTMYLLFTPKGIGSCSGTSCAYSYYCAYHSWIGTGSTATLYANMPYPDPAACSTGASPSGNAAADSWINLISHEHNETITDPLGSAWYSAAGNENGDNCAWNFGAVTATSTAATPITKISATMTYGGLLYRNYATVTLGSAPTAGLTAGSLVTISGSSSAYNGTYTIAAVLSSTSFGIANSSTTNVNGGTATQVTNWYNQTINGHHYALQQEWSNQSSACSLAAL